MMIVLLALDHTPSQQQTTTTNTRSLLIALKEQSKA